MLWVDKHRPKTLDALTYHKEMAARLQALADTGEIPHMLFYGPPGAGKKTRVMALLRALFGSGVEKTKLEARSIKTPSNRTVDVTSVASAYHIEMNPGDAGMYDRVVVQEVIKDIARFEPLSMGPSSGIRASVAAAAAAAGDDGDEEEEDDDVVMKRRSEKGAVEHKEKEEEEEEEGSKKGKPRYKVLVLTEVDQLTRDAQAALRRTMELYMSTCRLILICESPTRVIEPLRSRCLGIRVAAPTPKEVMDALEVVSNAEHLRLPKPLAARLAKVSERNLRRAVLLLESCKVAKWPFEPNQPIQTMDWERYIAGIAADIAADQSPGALLRVRAKLYELLVNCIPPDVIFARLTDELCKLAPEVAKHQIAAWAAHFEHRSRLGQKPVFHLEGFVARAMFSIKHEAIRAQTSSK